eukprot:9277-Eustigmatos_ZCMA.PRE.1
MGHAASRPAGQRHARSDPVAGPAARRADARTRSSAGQAARPSHAHGFDHREGGCEAPEPRPQTAHRGTGEGLTRQREP